MRGKVLAFYILVLIDCVIAVFCVVKYLEYINSDGVWFYHHYYKIERKIVMRDGVRLYTAIYIPKDNSEQHPILLMRTPYSCGPYGEREYRYFWKTPYMAYFREKYIIVLQDVRGKFMSEGSFEIERPFIPDKKSVADVDEASDAYDTIDWLIKNVSNNNGKVGVLGVSCPGFYATMAALCGHPALKAVSPQAPVIDKFMGDDTHHNGVLFLSDEFNYDRNLLVPFPSPSSNIPSLQNIKYGNKYQFFLKAGTYSELSRKYMGDSIPFWNDIALHPNYDDWWHLRNVAEVMKDIKPAMLIVGGLFDEQDNYGPWRLYEVIKKQSPNTVCKIVEGPWYHGQWLDSVSDRIGNVRFESNTSEYYFKNIELPFFDYYLKGEGDIKAIPEASVFVTGENKWHTFAEWLPKNDSVINLYLNMNEEISFDIHSNQKSIDSYKSDPMKPVPYTDTALKPSVTYMCEDQRFLSNRPDVLIYETKPIEKQITVLGPVIADIYASISTTDADFVVKIIDVFPDDFKYANAEVNACKIGGYQMLVMGDVMRGRFRNSFERPEPFIANRVTQMKFQLPTIAHTFKQGHRIMIQIQSTWFPLADRNPQQYINPYTCQTKDLISSTISIYHDSIHHSDILLPVLN